MTQRHFYTMEDGLVQIESADLPDSDVMPVELGGTGLDHIGTTNQVLVTGGASGLFWRHIMPQNIHTVARTDLVGTEFVIGTFTSLTDGDVIVWDTGTGTWINMTMPVAGAHDILSATHTDTLASAVSRGSTIVGNSTPKWAELSLGSAGKILRSDGTDLLYSGFTIVDSGTSGGVPYYSSNTAISSSAALTANLPVIGGGAGAAPSVGTRSGNTTSFATTTGTLTGGDVASWDANGNAVASGTAASSLVTASSTTTFTNKTYDVEATGNVFTIVEEHCWYCCVNEAAAQSLVNTNRTATGLAGANVRTGYISLPGNVNGFVEVTYKLPDDWVGQVDGGMIWGASTTDTGNSINEMSSSCPAAGATYDTAYNAATQTTTAGNGTVNAPVKTSFSNINMTGATAGSFVSFKFARRGDNGSDTGTFNTDLFMVYIRIRRTM